MKYSDLVICSIYPWCYQKVEGTLGRSTLTFCVIIVLFHNVCRFLRNTNTPNTGKEIHVQGRNQGTVCQTNVEGVYKQLAKHMKWSVRGGG